MNEITKLVVSGFVGAVLPGAGALYFLGARDNRVDQVERRVAVLERRVDQQQRAIQSPNISPVARQCAELARQRAAGTGNSYDIEAAMERLACFRAN
jgi:hypothetical protein